MADLRRRTQHPQSVHHAESGPEDGNDNQFLSVDRRRFACLDGSLDLYINKGKVPKGIIGLQYGDLFDQVSEF